MERLKSPDCVFRTADCLRKYGWLKALQMEYDRQDSCTSAVFTLETEKHTASLYDLVSSFVSGAASVEVSQLA